MGIFSKIAGFFTGGDVAGKAVDIADKAFHTAQERSEQDAQDTADARAFTVPSHESMFDVFVDGMNRLVRPAFAFWAFGVLVGWWGEKIKEVSPEAMNLILLVVTFYFGGRAILKDLPSVIKLLRK